MNQTDPQEPKYTKTVILWEKQKEKGDMAKIITVSREFGSGGRELGKRLAGELGFSYYDREIVTTLAEQTGLDEKYLERQLEKDEIAQFPIHFAQSFSQISAISETTIQLKALQTKLIKEIAKEGNCLIVGRAADSILEEYEPFKLFVYADQESKLARCRSRATAAEEFTDKEIVRQMKKIDRSRAEYHDIISSHSWGQKESYHLCINTTGAEIKKLIPAVAAYYRAWSENKTAGSLF